MKTLFILLLLNVPLIGLAHKPDLKHLSKSSSGTFIENVGQLVDQDGNRRADIDFKMSAPGMSIFVGEGQLHYQWYKVTGSAKPADYFGAPSRLPDLTPDTIITYRMDVVLEGANINAEVIKEEPHAYYENYYLPQCPDGAKARAYTKITYKNIYPNIDWVLYTNADDNGTTGLKYDFVVHPGGDVRDIKLRYEGATALTTSGAALTATTPFGSITEKAPYSYERETGKTIPSAFVLKGNILSFNAAAHSGTLVIDPEIEWATYYGGSEWESSGAVNSIATDEQDNIHMVGSTSSANNIATTGSFQDTLIGDNDGYIVRLNSLGARVWATYYGGKNAFGLGRTSFYAITTYRHGIYIAGSTTSLGLATPGTHKELVNPVQGSILSTDAIILKTDSTGARIWATYYGGDDVDGASAIAADDNEDVYIIGTTRSKDGISAGDVHQTVIGSITKQNVYIAKLSSVGRLIWGTYFGAENIDNNPTFIGPDFSASIIIHNGKELYIAGATSCIKHVATSGVHSEVLNTDTTLSGKGVMDDGFLTKFDTSGKQVWGTYLGGTGSDRINALAVDEEGNAYIAGRTYSKENIATDGSFMPQISNSAPQISDGFISKFTPEGKQVWGTYYGGENRDFFNSLTLDAHGDICLTGLTESKTGVATTGAWKPAHNGTGNADGIFIKFDRNGNRLWGTYYGSDTLDYTMGIAAGSNGIVYISGVTYGQTSIATSGAHQPILGGASDNFLIKSTSDSIVYLEQPFDDTVICYNSKGAQVRVGYIVSRSFRSGNVFTAELSDANGSFTSPTIIGTKAGTASGYIYCTLPNNLARTKGYRIRVVASAPYYVSNDNGIDIELKDGSEHPIITGDTALCAGETLSLKATSATTGASFRWAGPNGYTANGADATKVDMQLADSGNYIVSVSPFECRTNDTLQVKVFYTPSVPTISHNAPICEGDTLVFRYEKDQDTTVHYGIGWPNPNANFGDGIITDRATAKHAGRYVVVATKEPCRSADSTEIEIYPAPRFAITTNSPLKTGQDLKLSMAEDRAVSNYVWTGPDDFSSTERDNIIPNASAFNAGIYYISGTKGGCKGTDSVEVLVNEGEDFLILFPNPNDGQFTLRGNFKNEQEMQLRVVNAAGQLIYKESFKTIRRQVNRSITLHAVASGVYTLHVRYPGASKSIPFTVTR